MKVQIFTHFVGLLLALGPVVAEAQLDSSSALILRPSSRATAPSRQTLDSNRYKIRAPESRREDDLEEKPGTMIPTPVVNRPSPAPAPAPTPAPAPPPPTEPIPSAEPAPPPPVTQQVKDLLLGGRPEEIEEVRSQIHPQDPRANVIEISLAPAYFYSGSQSDFYFRDYSTSGPGMGLGMNIWMTPMFGLHSRYFTSFSSGVRSGGTNVVPVDIQALTAGLRFRKHFGYSRKATYLSWGIDYHDTNQKIGTEATTMVGHKTSGLGVSLEVVVPTSMTYAHTLEMGLRPRLKHNEAKTGIDVRSGTKAETNAVALGVGGHWTLDRRNQIFWRSEVDVERNLFKGTATSADPRSGNTPEGVSVTNTLLMFTFGFRWGS